MTTEASKKLLHYIIFNYNADETLLNFAQEAIKEEYAIGLDEGVNLLSSTPSK